MERAAAMPDQEYVESRDRALAVRQYLVKHFHLKPARVGIMPLGDRPLPHTRKECDGDCLALVARRA